MRDLAKIYPDRYRLHSTDFLKTNNIEKIIVFVREPITRFRSGLQTQLQLYNFNELAILNKINNDLIIPNFDMHTSPQFWFLLSATRNYKVNFIIKPLSDIQFVDKSIKKLNPSTQHNMYLSQSAIDKLTHFLTEDIVLYNQFMNITTSIDDIKQAIRCESSFVNNIKEYTNDLTYLLN